MTNDEAIAWAVKNLTETLQHEFYSNLEKAQFAATALATLAGRPYAVERRKFEFDSEERFVVFPSDQSLA